MISVLKGSLLELVFTLKYWNFCLIWSNFEMLCRICNYWKSVLFLCHRKFFFSFFSVRILITSSCILEPIYLIFFFSSSCAITGLHFAWWPQSAHEVCGGKSAIGTGYSLSTGTIPSELLIFQLVDEQQWLQFRDISLTPINTNKKLFSIFHLLSKV